MSDENPLEELYVDESDINRERLSEALKDKIGIDQEKGSSVILSGFSDLTQSEKVFAFLLYRRAAFELDHLEEDELGVTSSELSEGTGVPEGTLRRTCSESNWIQNEEDKGGYFIPSFAIAQAVEEIDSG